MEWMACFRLDTVRGETLVSSAVYRPSPTYYILGRHSEFSRRRSDSSNPVRYCERLFIH